MIFSPKPSISNANLDVKCWILPLICFVHDILGHLHIASSGDLYVSCLQTGQCFGIENREEWLGRLSRTTFTIFGITSPALSIKTVSPILMSFRSISS